jgi:CRP-like cAMP-binding protein
MNSSTDNSRDNSEQNTSEGEKEKSFSFKNEEIIFKEGDDVQYLYIIKVGKVRLVKGQDNRLINISLLQSGDFLGPNEILLGGKRTSTAIALGVVSLVGIHKKYIQNELNQFPQWMKLLMKTLSERLTSSEDILRDQKFVESDNQSENYFPVKEENKIKEILKKSQF